MVSCYRSPMSWCVACDHDRCQDFVRFSSRREWQDVQPVPQDEGPEPVVPINYGPECE